MKEKWMFLVIGLAIGVFLFLFQSVCQDNTTGDLSAVPWWFPCKAGTSVTTSASTQ